MPSIESQLTPRERQVVNLLTSPKTASQADVARTLEVSRTTISRHVAKRDVQRAIQARLTRESDKARGELARLSRLLDQGFTALEDAVSGEPCAECGRNKLDIQELAVFVKVVGDARLSELKVAESVPPEPVDPHAAMDRERRRTTRAMRAALWIGSGRRFMGWPGTQAPPPSEEKAKESECVVAK